MGLPDDPNYQPETYFCEQCRPEDHKPLLAAIARGERPWEEAARKREAVAEAEKTKKGKRGRKSGVSRGSHDIEEGTPTRGSQKRKMEDSPAAPDLKVRHDSPTDFSWLTRPQVSSKKARANDPPTTPRNGVRKPSADYGQGVVAASVTELNNGTRKTVANNLVKAFVEHTRNAVNQAVFSLPHDTNVEESGTQLALLIEHAMYAIHCKGSGEPNENYKAQMRTILYNVKKNPDLRDRVLTGEVSAHKLASMDAQEMASDEQQRKDAAMKKELEKQHTIVQQEGPRIRRTHKGEEYVDEAHQVAAESTTSNAPVRRPSILPQDGEATKSPDTMSPTEGVRPTRPPSQGKSRPSVDTKRKSSANFNIDNVWSTVQGSPEATQQRFPELPAQSPGLREPAGPGTRADADIDALLKEEEAESPPYSPKEFAESDGTIWRGTINGGSLGRFHCAAKYAAGCSVENLRMTYQDLIPAELGISGRIDPVKADDYLCGLQYSQSSDVIVVSIAEPQDSNDAAQFNKLFNYFKSRSRYGVGTQHQNPAIKDIYLIPLAVGDAQPGLLNLLENKFSNPVQERMFMLPFVIKNTELPHNRDAAGAATTTAGAPPAPIPQTPITPYEGGPPHDYPSHPASMPQHQSSNGTTGPQPMQYQYSHPSVPYAPHQPHGGSQSPSQPPPPPAAISAQTVLGPELARAPAVLQLIAQAPNAGIEEMNVVKECIQEDRRAAEDLSVLTGMLQKRYDGGGEGSNGASGAATSGQVLQQQHVDGNMAST